jgi:hypothetical protein
MPITTQVSMGCIISTLRSGYSQSKSGLLIELESICYILNSKLFNFYPGE